MRRQGSICALLTLLSFSVAFKHKASKSLKKDKTQASKYLDNRCFVLFVEYRCLSPLLPAMLYKNKSGRLPIEQQHTHPCMSTHLPHR